MSIYHCDDCRYLHSQSKCPDIGPPWYTHNTYEQNVRLREEWFRKNTKSSFYHDEEDDR